MDSTLLQQQDGSVFDALQQIHDGKTHIGEYLCLIFKDLPIYVSWKDNNSIFGGCNERTAKVIGLSDKEEIIGKNDFELNMREEEAEVFRADDQKIIRSGQPRCNDIRSANYAKGKSIVHATTKFPVYDKDKKITGIACFFYETALESHGKWDGAVSDFYQHDIRQSFQSHENYYILVHTKTFRLTARQAECLTYVSMGKTIKQISNMLACSTRTIEDHMNILKKKLCVYSMAELIDCFWRNPIKWF